MSETAFEPRTGSRVTITVEGYGQVVASADAPFQTGDERLAAKLARHPLLKSRGKVPGPKAPTASSTREEWNAWAERKGVEFAAELPSKEAVIAAVEAKEASA